MKYLRKDEIEKLFAVANDREKFILQLLYDSGMRVGELVTTRISDVDLDQGYIHIQAERSKTRTPRAATIRAKTIEAIKQHTRPGQVWLLPGREFSTRPRNHLSVRAVQFIITDLAKKAGLWVEVEKKSLNRGSVTPHTLRHSHIIAAFHSGLTTPVVQKQVGHKKFATTEIYAAMAPELVREAYLNKFGEINETS